jgi:Flp pilus assembly protein TadG
MKIFSERDGNGQRGESIIECAFIFLILFMIIIGILDFSRALLAYHFVSEAARQGTRYAMVRGADCTPTGSGCPCSSSDVQTYLRNEIPGIDRTALTVNTTWPTLDQPLYSDSCPPANAGTNKPGCPVKVQASYVFNFALPLPSVTMTSTSEVVITQ